MHLTSELPLQRFKIQYFEQSNPITIHNSVLKLAFNKKTEEKVNRQVLVGSLSCTQCMQQLLLTSSVLRPSYENQNLEEKVNKYKKVKSQIEE